MVGQPARQACKCSTICNTIADAARDLTFSSIYITIMGADCCGGAAPPPCQEKTKDFGSPSEKLANHDPSKQWDEIVAEKRAYYDQRVAMFESIKAKYDAGLEAAKIAGEGISIEMPDGSVREGVKGVTTPMDIALGISKGLAKKSVVARVDGGTDRLSSWSFGCNMPTYWLFLVTCRCVGLDEAAGGELQVGAGDV
jgi:hypothetical protein